MRPLNQQITLMKSRRRIALPKAGTTPTRTRLQQGFAIDEMGFRVKLHGGNREGSNVRFGSLADIPGVLRDVRFAPKSGHSSAQF